MTEITFTIKDVFTEHHYNGDGDVLIHLRSERPIFFRCWHTRTNEKSAGIILKVAANSLENRSASDFLALQSLKIGAWITLTDIQEFDEKPVRWFVDSTNKRYVLFERYNFDKLKVEPLTQQVINWINQGFNLQFDGDGTATNLETCEIITQDQTDFKQVYRAICQYISKHSNEFELTTKGGVDDSGFHKQNHSLGQRWQWWTKIVDKEDDRIGIMCDPKYDSDKYDENGRPLGNIIDYKLLLATRGIGKIKNPHAFIHPGCLTEEQYEQLKQLVPSACKVKGCCNNYPDNHLDQSYKSRVTVKNDKCLYHYRFNNINPSIIIEQKKLIHEVISNIIAVRTQDRTDELDNLVGEANQTYFLILNGLINHEDEYIKFNQLLKQIIQLAKHGKSNDKELKEPNNSLKTDYGRENPFFDPIFFGGDNGKDQNSPDTTSVSKLFKNADANTKATEDTAEEEKEQSADNFFFPLIILFLPLFLVVKILITRKKVLRRFRNSRKNYS